MHPVFCPPVHPHNPRFVVTSPAPQLGREYPFFQRHIIQIILVDDRTVAADPDPHHYTIKSTPKVKLQVKRGVSGGGYGCCLPWLERNILRRRFVPGRLTRTHSLPSAKRASIEATPSLLSDSFFWRRAADDSWAQPETMFGLCSLKLLVDPLLDQLCVINADPVCNAP